MSTDGEDIAAGIVQDNLPEHIALPKSNFLAWHKVRKQFVREKQWNELAKRNIRGSWRSELSKPSERAGKEFSSMHVSTPLRCLVIPGDHLLDVRSLWQEAYPLDCYIRYLGFNEGHGSNEHGTDVHVANNSVTSLNGVIPDSQILRDRFEAIAGDTVAHQTLKQYGPFHIVNLDLCGSMLPNGASDVQPYYNAIHKLLVYQFAHQKNRWLLFVTTMVEPAVLDKARMTDLCGPTTDNIGAHGAFSAKVSELCPDILAANSNPSTLDLSSPTDESVIRLFGIALGKWLLRMGKDSSPEWSVAMRRSYRYLINPHKGAVMLSLAYEWSPNFSPPTDSAGMSNLSVSKRPFPTEVESALKIAESVAHITDIDEQLQLAPEIRQELARRSADLMEAMGFDRKAYEKWVEAGEISAE